jgi:membrane protein implicated in regulation of membrane protease activity
MFTNTWSFIFAWYNLPFTFLLGVGLLLAVLQLIGLGGETEGEADAEADFDHEVELESEVDLDHELDSDLEGEAESDTDAEIDSANPSSLSWLAFLGVGKAPLLVVFLILFGVIGLAGWVMNGLLQSLFGTYPSLAFIVVLPVTVVIAGWVSSRIARFIGQALPPLSTTATDAQALVGRRGVVISPFVDDHYGLVHLRNAVGTLISVFAVTRAEATLKRGEPVVLVVYDDQHRHYQVTRAQEVLEPP